jgi:hypothetical protein
MNNLFIGSLCLLILYLLSAFGKVQNITDIDSITLKGLTAGRNGFNE